MPKNKASQQFVRGNIKECFPLKVLETGEELFVIEKDREIIVANKDKRGNR